MYLLSPKKMLVANKKKKTFKSPKYWPLCDFTHIHTSGNPNGSCGNYGCVLGIAAATLSYRMDRIKARQQKYKKGKERMLSLTQESGEGQDIQKLSEEDDESMSRRFPLVQVAWHWIIAW